MRRHREKGNEGERDAASAEAWEIFRSKLQGLKSYADALDMTAGAPSLDTPGHQLYSNFGFFLQDFTVPSDSTTRERLLYMHFIKMLDSADELKPGARLRLEAKIRHAIECRLTDPAG